MQPPKITCHKLWQWLPSDCKITDLASPQMNCRWFKHDYKRGVELQCALFIPFVWRSSSSALLWCLNLLANASVSSWKKTKPLPHAKTAEDKTDTQSQSSDVVCLFSAQPLFLYAYNQEKGTTRDIKQALGLLILQWEEPITCGNIGRERLWNHKNKEINKAWPRLAS